MTRACIEKMGILNLVLYFYVEKSCPIFVIHMHRYAKLHGDCELCVQLDFSPLAHYKLYLIIQN